MIPMATAIRDEAGTEYQTVKEAAQALGIPTATIYGVLNGHAKRAHNHTFTRIETATSSPHLKQKKSKETRTKMAQAKGAKPFQDETGKVYQTAFEAAEALGVRICNIHNSLRNGWKCSGHTLTSL